MKNTVLLSFEITCGESTCAYESGKFCKFIGTVQLGTVPVCRLFCDGYSSYTILKEKDGWVQRCDECLKKAKLKNNKLKMPEMGTKWKSRKFGNLEQDI